MTTVGSGKYTYRLVQDWPKLPPGLSLSTTSSVATDSQDRVYVFQRGEPPVWVFDREGNYLGHLGARLVHPAPRLLHTGRRHLPDRHRRLGGHALHAGR